MTDDDRLNEHLERYWGYRSFLPLQRQAVGAILAGGDSLVVLPTGGGKSLCYQLPALESGPGIALVVSPLISLMKDQVDALAAQGIPAATLNSSLADDERGRVLAGLRGGAYRLLYVSPERLVGEGGERFCRFLARRGVRYVAVDEAHCISQWGHDFRPEYGRLGRLRRAFPDAGLHAFTATATERVRRDIRERLELRDPRVLVGSFDRPNLVYRARRRAGLKDQVRAAVERHASEAGIVYCISRRQVEEVAADLSSRGVAALSYHAGLDDERRKRHQEAFVNEEIDVVVATVAFGMGIDRSNVRFVVHAGAPRSVEHYQQEAGRAGRDGLEAECLLIYSPADFATWRRLLAGSGELTEAARRQLTEISRYAQATRCRHRALVEYFGQTPETPAAEGCGACDWCLGELETVAEPVVLAQKILSCVLRLRQAWGMGQVIDVLRGTASDKVRSRRHHELSTFGLLEETAVAELRDYVEQLLAGGFLVQSGDRYPVLAVTPLGRRLLQAEVAVELFRQRRPEKRPRRDRRRAPGGEDSWEGVDRELFEVLRRLRLELARERKVPPYVIFHDSVLRHLARQRPSSREDLLLVPGIGERKADDLGPRFLAAIDGYRAEKDPDRAAPSARN